MASPYTAPEPSPYTTPQPSPHPMSDPGASPGLAFLLGFIPGVGAIYNGQYVKGLIHVVVLGSSHQHREQRRIERQPAALVRDDDRGLGVLHGL